jgi:hypothetical protein
MNDFDALQEQVHILEGRIERAENRCNALLAVVQMLVHEGPYPHPDKLLAEIQQSVAAAKQQAGAALPALEKFLDVWTACLSALPEEG